MADYEALTLVEVAAAERTVLINVPDVLLFRPADGISMRCVAGRGLHGVLWYGFPDAIAALQGLQLVDPWGEPLVGDRVRRAEIVEAYTARLQAQNEAAEVSGERIATEAALVAATDLRARRDAILDAPAATLDELMIKVSVASYWLLDIEDLASASMREERTLRIAAGRREGAHTMLLALAADLAALAEARGLLPVVASALPAQAAVA